LIKIHIEPIDLYKNVFYPNGNKKFLSGYLLFQKHCITCHAINEIGGEMGPELNYPKSVTSYWKEKDLIAYIVNPTAYRSKVKMPILGISIQQSKAIVEYLKYLSINKKMIKKNNKLATSNYKKLK
jgi:cytochrome c2